jgi:hypothetical protein
MNIKKPADGDAAAAAKKCFGHNSYSSDYLDLDGQHGHGEGAKTFRQILRSELANGLGEQVVIGVDDDGKSHDLLLKTAARTPLKKHGVTIAIQRDTLRVREENSKKSEAERERKHQIEATVIEQQLLHVGNLFAALFDEVKLNAAQANALRSVARALDQVFVGAEAVAIHGLAGVNNSTEFSEAIDSSKASGLFRIIGWLTVLEFLHVDEDMVALGKLLNLRLHEIAATARRQAEERLSTAEDTDSKKPPTGAGKRRAAG